jgi:hypothetical protein
MSLNLHLILRYIYLAFQVLSLEMESILDDNNHKNEAATATPSAGSKIPPRRTPYKGAVAQARARVQAKKEQIYKEAAEVAQRLAEPNVASVFRMLEVFGSEFVNKQVVEALRLHEEARQQGATAYEMPNTPVATGKNQPRTVGGVFFYLMKQHAGSLGLDWDGLRITTPWFTQDKTKNQTQPSESNGQPKSESGKQTSPKNSQSVEASQGQQKPEEPKEKPTPLKDNPPVTNVSGSNQKENPTSQPTINKPGKVKATLIGNLMSSPKVNPNGKEGLVELNFKVEMSQALPKGLPNLGESRVVVWCTQKQFNKLKEATTITPQTRFLIEGEPMPAVGSDLSPFLRLICIRLTTVELEQAKRSS